MTRPKIRLVRYEGVLNMNACAKVAYVKRAVLVWIVANLLAACSPQGNTAAIPPAQSLPYATNRPAALSFTIYTAGMTPGFLASAAAQDLASDGHGNMWFTDPGTPALGRISSSGTFTEFRDGLMSRAEPYVIARSPKQSSLWFSDIRGVRLGKLSPGGTIREYAANQYTQNEAAGVAIAPNGTPWTIAIGATARLFRLTKNNQLEAVQLPSDLSFDGSLTADGQGNLWMLATDAQTKVVMVERSAKGELITIRVPLHQIFMPCCPNLAPKRIVIGADGNPWFTDLDYGHKARSASFAGTIRNGHAILYQLRRGSGHTIAYASGIVAAQDGFWITGSDPFRPDGALWHLSLDGSQREYNLPSGPLGIAGDDAGHYWFTAAFPTTASQIVEFSEPQ